MAKNWASEECGCQLFDFSSESKNGLAVNLLSESLENIWLSEEGLPQWLCFSFKNLVGARSIIIRTVGWHCWHSYSTNPKVVKLHVSEDGNSFKLWDTLRVEKLVSGAQLFCCAPLSTAIYPFISLEIIECFGAEQCYMNRIYCYRDEIPASPAVQNRYSHSPNSSIEEDLNESSYNVMKNIKLLGSLGTPSMEHVDEGSCDGEGKLLELLGVDNIELNEDFKIDEGVVVSDLELIDCKIDCESVEIMNKSDISVPPNLSEEVMVNRRLNGNAKKHINSEKFVHFEDNMVKLQDDNEKQSNLDSHNEFIGYDLPKKSVHRMKTPSVRRFLEQYGDSDDNISSDAEDFGTPKLVKEKYLNTKSSPSGLRAQHISGRETIHSTSSRKGDVVAYVPAMQKITRIEKLVEEVLNRVDKSSGESSSRSRSRSGDRCVTRSIGSTDCAVDHKCVQTRTKKRSMGREKEKTGESVDSLMKKLYDMILLKKAKELQLEILESS